jgi:hypothetical protein
VQVEPSLEERLGDAIDRVLDVFEQAAEDDTIEPMGIIIERLRARGVELPAWVEMMI